MDEDKIELSEAFLKLIESLLSQDQNLRLALSGIIEGRQMDPNGQYVLKITGAYITTVQVASSDA